MLETTRSKNPNVSAPKPPRPDACAMNESGKVKAMGSSGTDAGGVTDESFSSCWMTRDSAVVPSAKRTSRNLRRLLIVQILCAVLAGVHNEARYDFFLGCDCPVLLFVRGTRNPKRAKKTRPSPAVHIKTDGTPPCRLPRLPPQPPRCPSALRRPPRTAIRGPSPRRASRCRPIGRTPPARANAADGARVRTCWRAPSIRQQPPTPPRCLQRTT